MLDQGRVHKVGEMKYNCKCNEEPLTLPRMSSGLRIALCVFLIHILHGAAIPLEPELVLVSVIFRHGARTTYAFYPTDPNRNETFYPIGFGGLTNEGKLGEYKLGRYLKNLYGDFLGDVYTEEKVFVRSTDVTRTKMSAQLVLAGLFPPSDIQQWKQDLNWQPIPVAYKSNEDEDLFHPSWCEYKKNIVQYLPQIEEVQNTYITPYVEVFNYIQENSGKSMETPTDMQDIFFIFKTESDMNLTMPEWTKTIFPEPTQCIGAQVYSYENYDARVRQINSGYLLKKILDDSKEKIEGVSKRKVFLYSGHESTLGYMLSALNVDYKRHIPPYGSAISFELLKRSDRFYIRLRYRNDTDAEEPVDLKIPGCDVLCPFEQFVKLQKQLIPVIPIEEACRWDADIIKDTKQDVRAV